MVGKQKFWLNQLRESGAEKLLQPIAFLLPAAFELNAHAIRSDRSHYPRFCTPGRRTRFELQTELDKGT